MTELRGEAPGVIWMGEGKDMTATVHSQKTVIVLRDKALNEWIRRGQREDFKERASTVQTGQVSLISAYQPLSSHSITELDKYRYDIEDLMTKILTKNLLIMGRDHNAHIGGKKAPATCRMFGLKTPTNEDGHELMAWCKTQSLQWANSF